MTKTTLEEKIKEIVARGYLARSTNIGRAFPFMDTPEWEGFVKGCSDLQTIELLSLFASELKAEKKRWIEKVRMKWKIIIDNEASTYTSDCHIDDIQEWVANHHTPKGAWDRGYNQAISELNEKLTKLEEEKE